MDISLSEQLKRHDIKTPKFTLENHSKLAKVVDVYDGDSCQVVFEHNRLINKWNVIRRDADETKVNEEALIYDDLNQIDEITPVIAADITGQAKLSPSYENL